MDDPRLDPAEHRAALAGLARINRLSLSADILWPPVAKLARRHPGRTLRVLDVATGSGDVPVGVWRKARRAGVALEIAGRDLSPVGVEDAAEHAAGTGNRVVEREL